MENWKTEESVDSLEVRLKDKRSILLLVICILTWVGSMYSLVMLLLSLAASNLFKAFQDVSPKSGLFFFGFGILSPVLCSLGAFLMFSLKRWGFWIYFLGEFPPIVFSVYTMLALTKSFGGGMFFGLLTNLIPIAFIVMYAIEMGKLNKKPVSIDF
ncbi:hypothetical protein [Fluviicola sp.]|uniref:hypothetical protein n=1 Tax=Fluviicola sp. TaxID=1917219 RepID=UPI002636FAB3|nr:hypothetical protein [Fluviicola sp.]